MTVITNKASFPNGVVVEDTNLVEFALTIPTSDKIFSLQDIVFLLHKFSFLDKSGRILNINKCFPKMSHGVGKSKKKSHSMPKMVKLAIVWKPEVCSLIVLQGRTKNPKKLKWDIFGDFQTMCDFEFENLHLWLRWIVTEWHRITSNVVKAFLTKAIPVSNKSRSWIPEN